MASGLEVVEEPDALRRDFHRERRLVEGPREIRREAAPVHHGPGDAEARRLDRAAGRTGEEARDGGLERRELPARQRRLAHERELAVADVEEREGGLRAADVPREDHAGPSTALRATPRTAARCGRRTSGASPKGPARPKGGPAAIGSGRRATRRARPPGRPLRSPP